MNRAIAGMLLIAWAAAGSSPAAVVVERWGLAGRPGLHLQHPHTLVYEMLPGQAGRLMRFDLSALPAEAQVFRARLFFPIGQGYRSAFEVASAVRHDGRLRADRPLRLVAPRYRWFDATAAVARPPGGAGRTALFLLRRAPDFEADAAFLEIAYEGRLTTRLKQVSEVKAFCRGGQVFVTFREIEDLARGRENLHWGEFAKRVAGWSVEGPVPDDRRRELRYRVYRHDKPITARTIARAELLGEVPPGSGYNTRLAPPKWQSEKATPAVLRLAVDPPAAGPETAKPPKPPAPLPPGLGLYVHTVRRPGKGHYAVVVSLNGVENTLDVGRANTAGPVAETPGSPAPVLQREIVKDLNGTKYHQQWYSLWARQPLAPRPMRYDLTVEFCPQLLASPAPLTVARGHAWGLNPEPGRPGRFSGLRLSHSEDEPNSFWMGVNDACGTLKGVEQGRWQPFTQRRQEYLVRWVQSKWRVDPQRIVAATGAWGMMEIERGGLYSHLVGWGQPEVTRGFQCWEQAVAAWGPPAAYADRPAGEDPYRRQDYSSYVLDRPRRELPYFAVVAGWGMHLTEMGWPAFPRFFHALVESKRAFVAAWDQKSPWNWRATPVHRAVAGRDVDLRRNQSLPAFGRCSLDDNPGDGRLGTGDVSGQINGYLMWQTQTVVDDADAWSMTVWLDESAPKPACTVDLTPRRCQRFKVEPGQKFNWTNSAAGKDGPGQSGRVVADRYGLVTLPRLVIDKTKHRIVIRRAGPGQR